MIEPIILYISIAVCDLKCTSGCTTRGGGLCDSSCVFGYGLVTTGPASFTCVGKLHYWPVLVVTSEKRLQKSVRKLQLLLIHGTVRWLHGHVASFFMFVFTISLRECGGGA